MNIKILSLACLLSALGFGFSGCDKSGAPVVPSSEAVLNLTIPKFVLNSKPSAAVLKKLGAKNTLPDTSQGMILYHLTAEGQAPVTGEVDFNSGSEVGTITIPLPKAGVWLVAAEWFYLYNPSAGVVVPKIPAGLSAIPEFAGADKVLVQGTTNFTVDMEDIGFNYPEYNCYSGNMTDSTNPDFTLSGVWLDLFSFDSGQIANSLAVTILPVPIGDIQASYDAKTLSTYFTGPVTGLGPNPPVSIYAYLGNGDFVNFPSFPADTVFYADTIQAKSAVTGMPGSILAGNDIFAVKVPSTNGMAWIQFNAPNVQNGTGTALESFRFIYNSPGLNYMKFQETTYGHANCNQNVP